MEQEPILETDEQKGDEVAKVLRGFGEEQGFDQQTCDEIAEMPFGDAFETAYSYLTQAGMDADEVLAEFMQESEE